jgi:hypothetical protein
MVLVLVLGGGLGWVVNRANTRRRAVALIREKAAIGAVSFAFDYQVANGQPKAKAKATSRVPAWMRRALGNEFFHDVAFVFIDFSMLNGRDASDVMAAIRQLSGLRNATLDNAPADVSIRGLDRLEKLALVFDEEVVAGRVDLGTLPRLRTARLDGRGVNDAALAQISKNQSLRELLIDCQSVTDAGLRSLAALKGLRSLTITNTGEKAIGPGLECLEAMKDLRVLDLGAASVSEAGLAHLAGLTELEILRIGEAPVTDAVLESMGRLTKLGELTIGGPCDVTDQGTLLLSRNHRRLRQLEVWSGITDAGLEHLANLEELEDLRLPQTITDVGLAHFRGRLPNLKRLYLNRAAITDAGLAHLQGRKLDDLQLNGSAITDAGLAHLRGMRLLNLQLSNTAVGDAGLEHLREQTELIGLWLGGTRVTDAGLVHLRGLEKLQTLDAWRTGVSPGGIAALQAAIPSLQRATAGKVGPAGAPIGGP